MYDLAKTMKDKIVHELGGTFQNIEKRIHIVAEIDKYRWKEDESVWNQKMEKSSMQYECSLDGTFVCFMGEEKSERQTWVDFLTALKELIRKGQVFAHVEMYKIKEAEEEERVRKSKIVEIPEAHTPEEKIIADVLVQQVKKKGRKVKRV